MQDYLNSLKLDVVERRINDLSAAVSEAKASTQVDTSAAEAVDTHTEETMEEG
jgi:hypothetical protein